MTTQRTARRGLMLVALLVLTAIFSSGQQKTDCTVRVTLLELNDVYQFAPVDRGRRGGLARVLTLKREIAKGSPNLLFLLAGDTITPSVESITYKGVQMIESWNALGLDYATFGNHEFDYGPEVLRSRMKESRFQWLAANLVDKKTGKPFGGTAPFVVREFSGVKVGIFGLVWPETKNTSRPGPDVEFLDPCETARKIVPQIRAAGAKVVVALTHLSMREDKEVARCADVNVIVGGHEHTLLQSMSGHTLISKMTADARELGRVDLNISRDTGELESIDWKVIPVTDLVKDDPDFDPVYRKYSNLLATLNEVVGRTGVELDARSAINRTRETNIGDFVADAFRAATGAEVGLTNGGSIRADTIVSPGPLTARDVLALLPFDNRVVKLQVTGATLRAALEHGVGRTAEDSEPGRFPQVSGLRLKFDASRPVGSRMVSITVSGKPLDNTRAYTLATTTYLAIEGGDDYNMFKGARLLIPKEQWQTDANVLRKAISAVMSIAPQTDGRIERLDKVQGQKSECQ
jgi:5'-nucleotidase